LETSGPVQRFLYLLLLVSTVQYSAHNFIILLLMSLCSNVILYRTAWWQRRHHTAKWTALALSPYYAERTSCSMKHAPNRQTSPWELAHLLQTTEDRCSYVFFRARNRSVGINHIPQILSMVCQDTGNGTIWQIMKHPSKAATF